MSKGSNTDFEDGAQLVGALMAASAKDLSWTRDRIEEGLRDEVSRLRTLVVEMAEVIEQATVLDRQSEERWRFLEPRIWSVEEARVREGSAS